MSETMVRTTSAEYRAGYDDDWYDTGWAAGENAGYEAGHRVGYQEGEKAGYDAGYAVGQTDGYKLADIDRKLLGEHENCSASQ